MTLFDTAEAYGEANERLLGQALAPVRDTVVYATKFGFKDGNSTAGLDSSPERIRIVAEQSPSGCRLIASTCSTSTASTRTFRSKRSRVRSRS